MEDYGSHASAASSVASAAAVADTRRRGIPLVIRVAVGGVAPQRPSVSLGWFRYKEKQTVVAFFFSRSRALSL